MVGFLDKPEVIELREDKFKVPYEGVVVKNDDPKSKTQSSYISKFLGKEINNSSETPVTEDVRMSYLKKLYLYN